MRRHIFDTPKLYENLGTRALGEFELNEELTIDYLSFVEILKKFKVQNHKGEVLNVFNFLDYKNEGEIYVLDIHESLLSYIDDYEIYTNSVKDSFKLYFNNASKYCNS